VRWEDDGEEAREGITTMIVHYQCKGGATHVRRFRVPRGATSVLSLKWGLMAQAQGRAVKDEESSAEDKI
jgi:hypothetical protein